MKTEIAVLDHQIFFKKSFLLAGSSSVTEWTRTYIPLFRTVLFRMIQKSISEWFYSQLVRSESLTESLLPDFEIQTIEKNPSKNRRSGSLQFSRLAREVDFARPLCPLLKDKVCCQKRQPFPPWQREHRPKVRKNTNFLFPIFRFFEKSPPTILDFWMINETVYWKGSNFYWKEH